MSFVGSHQWTSPLFKASESSFSLSPRSRRLLDEKLIEVDLTAGINKAAADSLISPEPIFLMYCILDIWSNIHIDAVRIDLVALWMKRGGGGVLLIDSGGLKIPRPSYSSFNGDSSFPSKSISINSPEAGDGGGGAAAAAAAAAGGWSSSLLQGRRYSLKMCFISREQDMTAPSSRCSQTLLDVRRNTSN